MPHDSPPASTASATPQRPTDFGAVALAFAAALTALWLTADFSQRLGIHLPRRIEQNLSNFIFDFGFIWDLFTLLFVILGLFRRGSSRRLALLGLGVLVLPWILLPLLG